MGDKPSIRVTIVHGDITEQHVDVIVNAANTTLLGGGGVDGAIHRAAGPQLLEECRVLGGCDTGGAKITRGYNLPAAYVIHTVGPVWVDGESGEQGLLMSCYKRCYELARQHGLTSIAFPTISTGVFRFPLELATRIAALEFECHLLDPGGLFDVRFVCFDEKTTEVYERVFGFRGILPQKSKATDVEITLSEREIKEALRYHLEDRQGFSVQGVTLHCDPSNPNGPAVTARCVVHEQLKAAEGAHG